MKETELGPPVLEWLAADEWTVYTEVPVHGGVADIVATRGPVRAIVELKVALSFDLLAQCERGMRYAHVVYAAVPVAKSSDGRRFAERTLRRLGIGLLLVEPVRKYLPHATAHCEVEPVFRRRVEALGAELGPVYQTVAPGTTSPTHFIDTPFKRTCRDLARVVRETPGVPLKDAIARLRDNHYQTEASARAAIPRWVERGFVPGVELRRDGRRLLLYPR